MNVIQSLSSPNFRFSTWMWWFHPENFLVSHAMLLAWIYLTVNSKIFSLGQSKCTPHFYYVHANKMEYRWEYTRLIGLHINLINEWESATEYMTSIWEYRRTYSSNEEICGVRVSECQEVWCACADTPIVSLECPAAHTKPYHCWRLLECTAVHTKIY